MNAINEPLEDVVRRFRWVSDDIIHVINPEGIEKYVSIEDKFKDLQFNFIPLYDATISKKYHYLYDMPSHSVGKY